MTWIRESLVPKKSGGFCGKCGNNGVYYAVSGQYAAINAGSFYCFGIITVLGIQSLHIIRTKTRNPVLSGKHLNSRLAMDTLYEWNRSKHVFPPSGPT